MRFAALFALAGSALGQQNTLTASEIEQGWVLLFDGETMFGWTAEGDGKWSVEDGALAGDPTTFGWLRSGGAFGDFVFRCEFRTTEAGNSGIFLRSAREGQPHVTGYELQIWNKNPNPKFLTGSLVNHATAEGARFKPDEWNAYEVKAEGDRYQIKLNGKLVLDTRQNKSRAGHFGLQVNRTPIAFRNLKLKPLGLKPLFNGNDLTGWRKVDAPKPPAAPPEWTVRGGAIHVEKGPGQIETEAKFRNFVLQMAIRTNPNGPTHHPNSGVFMRGDPGGYWSGYESQIRNEYRDGDRTQPVDYGTGAIYRNSVARKVVADDGKYFYKTIAANGRHFSVWVNGYPVTDWEDANPEGTNVRQKQARLAAGTLSLQAHDPTTNLDFRDIRIAELP
jgi:hypothetical protein